MRVAVPHALGEKSQNCARGSARVDGRWHGSGSPGRQEATSMTTLQVSPIPSLDDETNQIRDMTARIVAEDVIPNEHALRRGAESAELWAKIQSRVKESGLWAPHLPEEYGGMGIGFLKLAYMNEILAWSPLLESDLRRDGAQLGESEDPDQVRNRGAEEEAGSSPWCAGTMQSCFAMTEPDQPGSDPRSIQTTRAVREGDEWVINGHKWMASNVKRRSHRHRHVPHRGRERRRRERPHDPDHRPHGHAGLRRTFAVCPSGATRNGATTAS